MLKTLSLIFCLVFLAGCASSAPKKYEQMYSTNAKERAIQLVDIKSLKNSQELKLGKVHHSSINEHDNIVALDSYYSNYKMFQVNINDASSFEINIRSWCDCLGFTKSVLVPEIYLLNAKNQSVDIKLLSNTLLGAIQGEKPASLSKKWKALVNSSGVYTLVVYSNNGNIGQKVGALSGTEVISYGPAAGSQLNISSSLTSYPVGEFDLSVSM